MIEEKKKINMSEIIKRTEVDSSGYLVNNSSYDSYCNLNTYLIKYHQ